MKSTNAHSLINITSNTFQWLWVAGNFLLIDPEISRRRNRDVPNYDITKEPSIWKRFLWGLEYAINGRGIGWNWQVSGVQNISPRENRAHFVWQGVQRWIIWSIIEELILVYRESQPFYASYGAAPGYGSSADGGFVRMMLNGVLAMVRTYAQIQSVYSAAAVLIVAAGLAEPKVHFKYIKKRLPLLSTREKKGLSIYARISGLTDEFYIVITSNVW